MNRLRLQLIGLLIVAVVLPLLPAAFIARELIRRSLDPLSASSLAEGAEAGLAVTREVLEEHKRDWLAALRAGAPLARIAPPVAQRLPLPAGPDGDVGGIALRPGLHLLIGPEVLATDSTLLLVARIATGAGETTWVSHPLPDSLAARALRLQGSARLLQTLRREHQSVLEGFQSTFLVAVLALVVIVLTSGLLLISRLTRPLADLTTGIDRVAGGDWSTRVPERGSGEVTELMQRFNAMTGQLQVQQNELGRLERIAAWRQMAQFLAHEIKNPLTPIQLAAQQMRDSYAGDDAAYRRLIDESASIIEEEVQGMRHLVTEFSQFARLPEVHPAPVAAHELAAELESLYGESQLRTRVTTSRSGALADVLWCDRDPMKRVLVNLIDNGLASQRSAGCDVPVELSFALHADGATSIEVRDHGTGIPTDRRQRVFEPAFTTKRDGMGLGLAIVENIIRHHGGSIAIVDPAGEGAIFAITLPARHHHEGAPS